MPLRETEFAVVFILARALYKFDSSLVTHTQQIAASGESQRLTFLTGPVFLSANIAQRCGTPTLPSRPTFYL